MAALLQAYPNDTTRVLLAVVKLHQDHGRVTVRGVARLSGVPLHRTWARLHHLRDSLLVDWEDGQAGTLHPLVAVVLVP